MDSTAYEPMLTGWPAALIALAVIVLAAVVTVAFTGGLLWFIFKFRLPEDPLMTRGIAARARILEIRQTGMFVNYNPQVSMRLEVMSDEWEPYETTVQAVVPVIQAAQCQPGTELAVRIDPDNPWHVILERSAASA
jgi:hypothetical protein